MYPIEIRNGSSYGPAVDFPTAVRLAMGTDTRVGRLHVTAVYHASPETDGQPVPGIEAEVFPSYPRFGTHVEPAQVTMGGTGSHAPDVGMLRAQCYLVAIQVAAAANAAMDAQGGA